MTVDLLRAQLEQDVEDCISQLDALGLSAAEGTAPPAALLSLKQRLVDLCSALGRLGGEL